MPAPPFKYVMLQYRQRMKISPLELAITPHDMILADLEMMNLEHEYQPQQQTPKEE